MNCISIQNVFEEGNYTTSLDRFNKTINSQGYKADLAYNVALCHYRQHQFSQSLKFIAEIIDRGIKEHPGSCVSNVFISF